MVWTNASGKDEAEGLNEQEGSLDTETFIYQRRTVLSLTHSAFFPSSFHLLPPITHFHRRGIPHPLRKGTLATSVRNTLHYFTYYRQAATFRHTRRIGYRDEDRSQYQSPRALGALPPFEEVSISVGTTPTASAAYTAIRNRSIYVKLLVTQASFASVVSNSSFTSSFSLPYSTLSSRSLGRHHFRHTFVSTSSSFRASPAQSPPNLL